MHQKQRKIKQAKVLLGRGADHLHLRDQGSDLLALPFLLALALITLCVLLAFSLAGPIGMVAVVTLVLWALFYLFYRKEERGGFAHPGQEYLLVIANQGLESPVLKNEVLLRQKEIQGDVALLVPVQGKTLLSRLAGDLDQEIKEGRGRADSFSRFLRENSIATYQKIDIASSSFQAAADGMREKPIAHALIQHEESASWKNLDKIKEILTREEIPVTIVGDAVSLDESEDTVSLGESENPSR